MNDTKLIQEYHGKVHLELKEYINCNSCLIIANNEAIYLSNATDCKWLYDKIIQILEMIK